MLPDLIGTALAQLATDVSNFVLKSDAAQLEKLQSLSGNCIEFNSTAHLLLPAQSWHLLVTDQGLQFFHGTAPQPQVIVTAAPTELGAWLLNQRIYQSAQPLKWFGICSIIAGLFTAASAAGFHAARLAAGSTRRACPPPCRPAACTSSRLLWMPRSRTCSRRPRPSPSSASRAPSPR